MPSIERIAVQAAFPRPDGNVSCDLLPTDRCNASDKFNFLLINPIQTGLFFASQDRGGGGGSEALPLYLFNHLLYDSPILHRTM